MKYHVARDGQPFGIFLEYEVRDGLKSGELRGTDLYWREGMPEWLPLSSAPDVADAFDAQINPTTPFVADASTRSPSQTTGERAELATLGQRFKAALVDKSLGAVFMAFSMAGYRTLDAAGIPTQEGEVFLSIGGIGALIFLTWNVILLTLQGQTIGKKLMNIRVANYQDDSNPGFVKVVLLREVCNAIPVFIPLLNICYGVTDIAFIFREDRRCLHDLLADTRVVQGSLPTS